MVIFTTSKGELRRWIERSEGRMNVLRLCARGPCTVERLSSTALSKTPRFRVSVFGMLAEINVTIDVGTFLKRELLVEVERRPDPRCAARHTRYFRTSLLAFSLSPGLALLEPEAYTAYITSWLADPLVRERQQASMPRKLGPLAVPLCDLQRELFLVLPGYLREVFCSFSEPRGLEEGTLGGATLPERERIFGEYYLAGVLAADAAKMPSGLTIPQIWRARVNRVGSNQGSLARYLRGHAGELNGVLRHLPTVQRTRIQILIRAAQRKGDSPKPELVVALPPENALLKERLAPLVLF